MPQMRRVFGLAAAAVIAAGCTTTSGTAVAPGGGFSAAAGSVPGVEKTLTEKIPRDALLCYISPDGAGAAVPAKVRDDPAAPRIVIVIPGGWSSNAGIDPTLTLLGPQGMSGSVQITPTTDDPATAFAGYLAEVKKSDPGGQFLVEGAKFCGYSSQRITGRAAGLQIADRITHIWTNTRQYLVTIHLQGPASASDFDSAKTVLLHDFTVTIP